MVKPPTDTFFIGDNDLCDNFEAQFQLDRLERIYNKNKKIPDEPKVKY